MHHHPPPLRDAGWVLALPPAALAAITLAALCGALLP